ncbi:hypothetical protein [Poseidonocella sp. HB161398]|uniref:hypothetical protein n=1 Tax=Poseidonocella sp. HB161398 TaxID=2320855 RepID=UPI001109029B|nr:hypothetical protein [Poseidonocella sp. HB161398]
MDCILHIGTAKTGTTILQNWLYRNRAQLGAQGVYLSERLGMTNNRLLPAYFRKELDDWARRERIATQAAKAAYFDGFLEGLSAEIAAASATHAQFAITSEHLQSRMTERDEVEALRDFLAGQFARVKVVCYFRNQFDIAVSLYSTALKISAVADFDAFLDQARPENPFFNHARIADLWSGVFGRENCDFRIYDRGSFLGGDIRRDFLAAIDPALDFAALDAEVGTANESISLLEAAAFRRINLAFPYWAEDNGGVDPVNLQAKRRFQRLDALKAGRQSPGRRREIEDRFRDANSDFFGRYFGCGNRFASAAEPPEAAGMVPVEEVARIVDQTLEAAFGLVAATLRDRDADALRDIASKIARGDGTSLEDALALMKLARRARPNGPHIARMVEEWSARLAGE